MQEKFGKFYDAFNQHIETVVQEDNIDEWRNIRAIYEHFRGKFIEALGKVRENKR